MQYFIYFLFEINAIIFFFYFIATNKYQDAVMKLSIAEETSSEESIQQKWHDLQDSKKRKLRCQKNYDTDDDGLKMLIKKEKVENQTRNSEKKQNKGILATTSTLTKSLPELLTDQQLQINMDRSPTPPPDISKNNSNPDEIIVNNELAKTVDNSGTGTQNFVRNILQFVNIIDVYFI